MNNQSLKQKLQQIIAATQKNLTYIYRQLKNYYYAKIYYPILKQQTRYGDKYHHQRNSNFHHDNLIPIRTSHQAQDKIYPRDKK